MTVPMRILWMVNIPLPAASQALGLPESPFGGWLSTNVLGMGGVTGAFSIGSIIISVIGAVVVLFVYNKVVGGRG